MHRRFLDAREETHASFAPLRARYATLEKFEFCGATRDELAKLAGLDQAWASFAEMLGETEVSLEEHKESFRDKLTRMVDKLVNDVDEFEASFAATAPKSVADAVTHAALDAASAALASFDATAASLRAREAEVRKGLGIFGTAPPGVTSSGMTGRPSRGPWLIRLLGSCAHLATARSFPLGTLAAGQEARRSPLALGWPMRIS